MLWYGFSLFCHSNATSLLCDVAKNLTSMRYKDPAPPKREDFRTIAFLFPTFPLVKLQQCFETVLRQIPFVGDAVDCSFINPESNNRSKLRRRPP